MAVCKLGVACNGSKKNAAGEWVDDPNFFDVVVWGGQGEACAQYLSKGRPVGIQGRLDWHSWETDGQKRSKVEIIADRVQFLHSKGDDGSQRPAAGESAAPSGGGGGGSDFDDIPFAASVV